MSKENTCETQCTVPENIHNPPQKGSGFLGGKGIAGGGGSVRPKKNYFKQTYEASLKFSEGCGEVGSLYKLVVVSGTTRHNRCADLMKEAMFI